MDQNNLVFFYMSWAPIFIIAYFILEAESIYERIPLLLVVLVLIIPKPFRPPKHFNKEFSYDKPRNFGTY